MACKVKEVGWQPEVDTTVPCDTNCAGGAPELYEEDDIEVQDESPG